MKPVKNPNPKIIVWSLATLLAGAVSLGAAEKEPVDYVNPFIGAITSSKIKHSGSQGKTFPGVATPYGLVQLSPDSITGGDNGSGYNFEHSTLQGFSFTHMSGVGWYGDLGNFLVMPTTGPLKSNYGKTDQPGSGYLSLKTNEVAQAGYYAVTLSDYQVRAELTAAPHSGILRFTFPKHDQARIQIDLARRVGGTAVKQSVKVVDDRTIEGWMRCTADGGGWGDGGGHPDYTVYFHAEFSKPLKQVGVWSAAIPEDWKRHRKDLESDRYQEVIRDAERLPGCREKEGKHLGFYTEFATTENEVVLLKAGISFVSIEGARHNLQAEIADWDFDRVRAQARQLWSKELERITVAGGTEDQKAAFYTALYHAMIDPRAFADLDGSYPGADGQVHKSSAYTRRTVFSGWDVFRSHYPLMTIIAPTVVNDMVNSLVELSDESKKGYLERWEFLNAYSGCMVANPAVVVLADAYAKGIRDYDVPKAYAVARATCERIGNGDRGYAPGSISCTLEYAHNEWCVARLAESLGKSDDVAIFSKRAQSYRNLFDPSVGWFRNKDKQGNWAAWTDKGRLNTAGCVECNAYQQGWFVPHDVPGLIELLGGREKFCADLNSFFEKTPDVTKWNDYYNHSNEPVHLVPFLFNRAGKPWLTQKWVRFICENAYSDGPYGLCGDEDVGQMSGWYVLGASGIHQACPGDTRYELFTPLFNQVTLRLDKRYAKGGTFTISAKNNSKENIYIQSATLNGHALNRCWISHEEIMAGGTLELVLGPQPNQNWGLAEK